MPPAAVITIAELMSQATLSAIAEATIEDRITLRLDSGSAWRRLITTVECR